MNNIFIGCRFALFVITISTMPELPEVENVRRSLLPIVGRTITTVRVHRRDIVHGRADSASLGCKKSVHQITRHGKQMALVTRSVTKNSGREACVCVHLGMTGTLRLHGSGGAEKPVAGGHVHLEWEFDDGSVLLFSDPRRFGGIWTLGGVDALIHQKWATLGPDALRVPPRTLHQNLNKTRRALKAALLDQSLIAGLGNIYVDELLHRCRLHPFTRANTLTLAQIQTLVAKMRRLLTTAIDKGGSTLRDYVDSSGNAGAYQFSHAVYGRAGQHCLVCHQTLAKLLVAGRTTVFCPHCQGGTDDLANIVPHCEQIARDSG